jgi:signal transduction histidine kinase
VIEDLKTNTIFTKNNNIEIIFNSYSKEAIMVFADKTKIYQVINNLLLNAVKFTEKGKITVTSESEYTKDKKYVVVKIRDTGKGIDQEILPKIFDKFFTKSDSGTGLGLYITKKIVDMHGGTIKGYNNLEDRGATFEFTIPLEKSDQV